jgi:hypothetical protein
MAFSTWSALKTSILNDIADGSILTQSYNIANGRSRNFRSLREVTDFLQFCDMQIAAEGGAQENYVEFTRPGADDD